MINSLIIMLDATPAQKAAASAAINVIQKVTNSPEFRQRVLGMNYIRDYSTGFLWWKRWYHEEKQGYTSTDKTPQQIYDIIMSGATVDDPKPDQTLNFKVRVLNSSNGRVIGYTTPGSDLTNTYAWVFASYTSYELAGHFFHEMLHRIGFDHSSARDSNSVPYALGYLMEELGKKYS